MSLSSNRQVSVLLACVMLFVMSTGRVVSGQAIQAVPDSVAEIRGASSVFGQALQRELGNAREQSLQGHELRGQLLQSIRAAKTQETEGHTVVLAEDASLDGVGAAEAAEPVGLVEVDMAPFAQEEKLRVSARTPLQPILVPGDADRSNPLPYGADAVDAADATAVSKVGRISAVVEKEKVQLTGLAQADDGSYVVASDACAGDCVEEIADACEPAYVHQPVTQPSCCPTATPVCSCGCGSPMQCQSAFGGCCGQCGSLCGCDCSRSRLWARFDVLLWNINGYDTPALLTQSPAGTPANTAGLLGQPTTQVVAGNQEFGGGFRAGGRFQAGWWFDPCRKVGLQGDFFALDGGGESTVFNSGPAGTTARPFFNTATGEADAQIFGQPGLAEGNVRFTNSSDVISAGPSLRFNLCCCESTDCCDPRSNRTDFILGYRYFRLAETFASQEILNVTDPLFVDGTSYELNDSIRTQNDFHGVEFGLSHMVQQGRWGWDLSTLFAVGEVQRVVDLNGSTFIDVPGVQQGESPGGFYVGADQIGSFRDNDYAVIPQVRANLSYCIGGNWRLRAGYNFMYLSSAFRPNTFLNPRFDGTQLGQPVDSVGRIQRPDVSKSSLFLHGANVGLSYNF